MVLKVDQPHKTVLVSCDNIPGFMEAMAMPFDVRDEKGTRGGLSPGMMVSFSLVVDDTLNAEHLQVRP